MVRTANRPLATGPLQPVQVLVFAVLLGALMMTILIALVNPLTAALTFASLIGYAVIFVCTPPHFWALAIFRRESNNMGQQHGTPTFRNFPTA